MLDLALPAFGHLAAVMPDHVYEFDGHGFLFTSPWVHTLNTRRHAVTVLLSAEGRAFEVDSPAGCYRGSAVLVPTLVTRSLRAHDAALVSINLTPHHRRFADFRHRAPPDLQPLDYGAFALLMPVLRSAYCGELSATLARLLADQIADIALSQLPPSVSSPRRTTSQVLDLLRSEEAAPLAQVAQQLNLSYDRASHVVSDVVGLPLKSYMSWRKMMVAWRGLSDGWPLSDVAASAGFTDLAHFSRTWSRKLGVSPSYVRGGALKVIR